MKQQHQQWKDLVVAKLKLPPEPNEKTILIVLSGGVERVGKTGVAIEVIDQVARRGTVC